MSFKAFDHIILEKCHIAWLTNQIICLFIINKWSYVAFKKYSNTAFFPSRSERNINFFGQLFRTDGALEPWKQPQEEDGLPNTMKLKWIQLIHS